jgi:ketosteroid isomerase-like protein
MSEENVEIFRRHVAAFNDGDLDAMADLVTEDFEFIPYLAAVVEKTTTYRGRDGLRQYREGVLRDTARVMSEENVDRRSG